MRLNSRLLPGSLAERPRGDARGGGADLDRTAYHHGPRVGRPRLFRDRPAHRPGGPAGRLSDHLQEMNAAIVSEGGTALKHVRDAVMAALGSAERLEYTLVGDTVSGSAA